MFDTLLIFHPEKHLRPFWPHVLAYEDMQHDKVAHFSGRKTDITIPLEQQVG